MSNITELDRQNQIYKSSEHFINNIVTENRYDDLFLTWFNTTSISINSIDVAYEAWNASRKTCGICEVPCENTQCVRFGNNND